MVQVHIKLMIITPMIIDVDRFYIIKPSCWIPTILYQQKWKKGLFDWVWHATSSIKFPLPGQPFVVKIG